MPKLIEGMMGVRAQRSRIIVSMMGGASVNVAGNKKSFFRIGEENIEEVENFCRREGIRIAYKDVGGTINRTVHFEIGKGLLTVKKPTGTDEIEMR
jgi:chemotaxis protein CheD